MKFCLSANIAIYCLLTLSWLTLFTGASNENKTNTLRNLNNNVFGLIINQLLTIQDILILRTTCQLFTNLLRPNDEGMLTFCNYAESKRIINVNLYWINLEYFLNESYDNALYEMKIFTVSEDRYAILTRAPGQKIISWFKKNVTNNIQSEPVVKVYIKGNKNAWVEFIQGGSVQNFSDVGIPDNLLSKMKKIKTIVSTAWTFAVLLDNGDVLAWGGGVILDEIQTKLKNIKMIYSNYYGFITVSKDGEAYSWGHPWFLRYQEIPSDIENIKMIFSTKDAFAALLNDGNVRAWGNFGFGGQIPIDIRSKLKNVNMIFSNEGSFIALLQDGSSVPWGDIDDQELVQELVSQFYNNEESIK